MGDLAIKHSDCHFSGYLRHPELLRIRLDAHGIDVDLRDSNFNQVRKEDVHSYDIVILDAMQDMGWDLDSAICGWERLSEKGQMFVRCNTNLLQGGAEAKNFRQTIKESKALSKVILYPPKKTPWGFEEDNVALVIDKSKTNETITMCKLDTKGDEVLSITLKESEVDYNMLFPAYYLLPKPEGNTPLSKFCKIYKERDAATIDRIAIAPDLLSSDFSTARLDNLPYTPQTSISFYEKEQEYKEIVWGRLPETTSPTPYRFVVVNQPCVVVYATGKEFKIGYITTPREYGYMLSGMNCLIPQNGISVEDLALLLLTESVSKQMRSMTIGNARLLLTDEKLSKIIVGDDKDRQIKEKLISELTQQRDEIKRRHDEYKKTIRMRKHSLGQIMFELNTGWQLLSMSKEANNGCLNGDFIIGKKHPKRVDDIMKTIESCIKKIGAGIDNFVPEEDVRFTKKETFSLVDFVKEYISRHQSSNFVFEIGTIECVPEQTTENAKSQEGKNFQIYFSKAALEEILQNIIYNAEKHGFVEEGKENKIRISFKETLENVFLTISNNGKPINKDVNLDDIFMYGFTTSRSNASPTENHSGIGLFFVKSLMCDSQGDVECINDSENEFPVSFELKFKKTI